DHLARREVLPASQTVDLRRHPAGIPLKAAYTRGFVYSDGWVDDARLVVLNALHAQARGAAILTRTRCVEARREPTGWEATLV
ncbi:glycerol-3-phosphate dehydrogenase, partial [Escherichia coli]|nr:glycerol-3-phosphate dehydrogenase [Escherichia coli]